MVGPLQSMRVSIYVSCLMLSRIGPPRTLGCPRLDRPRRPARVDRPDECQMGQARLPDQLPSDVSLVLGVFLQTSSAEGHEVLLAGGAECEVSSVIRL